MATRAQTVSPRPSKLRARPTNRPRRLDYVDMRSADGRRYADLYDGKETAHCMIEIEIINIF